MSTFEKLPLPEALRTSLSQMKYEQMTPIQGQVIPLALEGKDILGSSCTGSGKTAAFSIPIIAQIMNAECGDALVLTPTRELASQVMQVMEQMISTYNKMISTHPVQEGKKYRKIETVLLIGGEYIEKQKNSLRNCPRLIVGTPGRIEDHLQQRTLNLKNTHFLIFDEIDRMLEIGFIEPIQRITKQLPKKRQTLMFSATLAKNIEKLAHQYLTNPVRIEVKVAHDEVSNIDQRYIHVSDKDKYDVLLEELTSHKESTIIFVRTKVKADRLAKQLREEHFKVAALHGDLRQYKRTRIVKDFRSKKYQIVVATDVAARGIDIPHIKHVINYDFPQCAEDYVHRIGRTGRAGKQGFALSFLANFADKKIWGITQGNPIEKQAKNIPKVGDTRRRKGSYRGKRGRY